MSKKSKQLAKIAGPIITCPPELGPSARAEWDRVVGELIQNGTITGLDRAALASYCVAYTMYIDAVESIQTYGMMVKSPNGYPQQSPYVSIANKQFEIMMRVGADFGFTPAARDRLAKPTTTDLEPFDPWSNE